MLRGYRTVVPCLATGMRDVACRAVPPFVILAPETMMSETPPQPEPEESPSDRRLGNIIIAVGLVLLLGLGWWLADAMYLARKADDCLSSGRRNCTPIDTPA